MNDVHTLSDAEIDRRIREGLRDSEAIHGPVFHGRRMPLPWERPEAVLPMMPRRDDGALDSARGMVNALLLFMAFTLGAIVGGCVVALYHLPR